MVEFKRQKWVGKRIGINESVLLILFIIISLLIINVSCSKLIEKKTKPIYDEWSNHSAFVLSLSQAIIDGIRYLTEELLISKVGFKNTDITILSGKALLLNANIKDFILQEKQDRGLFARWRIFRVSNKTIDYINVISFTNIKNMKSTLSDSLEFTTYLDSLHLDVFTATTSLFIGDVIAPPQIQLIYWRNGYENDRLGTLQMIKNREDRYTIKPRTF